MTHRIRASLWVVLLLSLSVLAFTTPAHAEEPQATAADRKEAARRFSEGERAFKTGQFEKAGAAFEDAGRLAPHPASTWNAARAWQRAGKHAKAANLYAKYLRDAALDAPDRTKAIAALRELSASVGRLEVSGSAKDNVATGISDVHVDGEPVAEMPVYVEPGSHTVVATLDGHRVERTLTATAGAQFDVVLGGDEPASPAAETPPPGNPPPAVAPAAPAPAAAALPISSSTAPTPAVRNAPAPRARQGWSPVVVIVGGGVTAFCGGLTIWSAVDAARNGDTTTTDSGRKRAPPNVRTGVFVGLTATAAVLTSIAAIWLVEWHSPNASVKAGASAQGFAASGTF